MTNCKEFVLDDLMAITAIPVADFAPAVAAQQKIKREGDQLTLTLSPTRDIARALGQAKRPGQVLVGFALETDHEEEHAREKLRKKNLDLIVLNSLRDEGAGFRHATNKVTLIDSHGETPFPLKTKEDVARDIVNRLVQIMDEKP